jgi:hypothetical protein
MYKSHIYFNVLTVVAATDWQLLFGLSNFVFSRYFEYSCYISDGAVTILLRIIDTSDNNSNIS